MSAPEGYVEAARGRSGGPRSSKVAITPLRSRPGLLSLSRASQRHLGMSEERRRVRVYTQESGRSFLIAAADSDAGGTFLLSYPSGAFSCRHLYDLLETGKSYLLEKVSINGTDYLQGEIK